MTIRRISKGIALALFSSLYFVVEGLDVGQDEKSQPNRVFTKCGFSSTTQFRTWFVGPTISTDSPVLFPENNEQLSDIVSTAHSKGCKVRVRGAGHSHDGLIMQKLDSFESDVVIVHLMNYKPDDAWNNILDEDKPTIRVSAGASTLRLHAFIRPKGYLLESMTAAPWFSVGGAYMNPSVHGSIFNASRYNAQVNGFQVMNATGHLNEYFDEEDVKMLRGSMGLLGIVTAMEIRLRRDIGLKMSREFLKVDRDGGEDAIRPFFARQVQHDGAEWFYFYEQDIIESFNLDWEGNPDFDYASTASWYDNTLPTMDDVALEGAASNMPYWFETMLNAAATLNKGLSRTVSILARQLSIYWWERTTVWPNDGFLGPLHNFPNFRLISYNVKCESDCVDELAGIMIATRRYLKEIISRRSSSWYPNLPIEFRLFTVREDELLLENLSPGRYLAYENFDLTLRRNVHYSKFHKELQDMWRSMYPGGGVHVGKEFGFGHVEGIGSEDDLYPFQDDAILDSVYSQPTRDAFIAKMNELDPSGTFSAGSTMRLLGLTTNKFTPRELTGGTCVEFGHVECFSGCCMPGEGVCVPSNKKVGDECRQDCECEVDTSGNPCRLATGDRGRRCRDGE